MQALQLGAANIVDFLKELLRMNVKVESLTILSLLVDVYVE